MTPADDVVFLLDVDNTLLDNDRVQDDPLDYDFCALLAPASASAGEKEQETI